MKKAFKFFLCLTFLFCFFDLVGANCKAYAQTYDDVNYVRDYQTKTYNSDNGLDGTAANCIYSSESGLIWIGTYTGLYRYDGSEFMRVAINGRNMPIKDIAESNNNDSSKLWIGTNGDGLWCYDEETFTEMTLDSDNKGAQTIDDVFVDSSGRIWVGTKGGLFRISENENSMRTVKIENLEGLEVSDIAELATGEMVAVVKSGGLYKVSGNSAAEIKLSESDETYIPRCVSSAKGGYYYVGTKGNTILKLSLSGAVEKTITCDGLSSFNMITELNDNSYWVCSDSGIGVLENDVLSNTNMELKDSVEGVCEDYQGGYWFASSRTGLLQLYPNEFSDLSAYWNLKDVVNTIQFDGDNIYVGTDGGLYCFNKDNPVTDNLTEACTGLRIREIYKLGDVFCVATYGSGLFIRNSDGKIINLTKDNSGLTTDLIRAVSSRKNGDLLLATENGVFVCEKSNKDNSSYDVSYLTDDEVMTSYRILDVKEADNGTVYAATDGNGLYVIKDGVVTNNFTKADGLFSECVLKVVPSPDMQGVWLVMSEGINFLGNDNSIQRVTAIPTANTTDLLITDDCKAIILAANGLFKADEADLLKTSDLNYKQSTKKDGIPVDFTANSWSVLDGEVLYICGTTGATCVDLNEDHIKDYGIRVYVAGIYADSEEVKVDDSGQIVIPSTTHRFSIDIRPINYIYQNIKLGYRLENIDETETLADGNSGKEISYTNIDGGEYTYHFRVLNSETNKDLIEIVLPVKKEYNFFEEPSVQLILWFLGVVMLICFILAIVYMVQTGAKNQYKAQLKKEKDEEIKRIAYNDLATGVYNRNYYEALVDEVDMRKVYSAISVSVNHMEYYKKKYGVLYVDSMMRKGADVIKAHTAEDDVMIFRLSENIFFYWLKSPVKLEEYIYDIKSSFSDLGTETDIYSLAVGGVYNNGTETLNEMLEKCEKMRTIDENLAEAKFVKSKIQLLN